MSASNKHKISEKELDNLLNQVFLNLDFNKPENEKLMETLSQEVMAAKPLAAGIAGKILSMKFILAIVAVMSIIITAYFYTNKKDQNAVTSPIQQKTELAAVAKHVTENEVVTETGKSEKKDAPKQIATNNVPVAEKKEDHKMANLIPNAGNYPVPNSPREPYLLQQGKQMPEDSAYVFPKLTEKEIKATQKQKEKMTNWLLKQSKERYSLVKFKGSGSVMADILDTTASFYMQNYEVTNLEYRTFLFDLLINDRKQDFLIAKPNQSLWLNTLGTDKYNVYKDVYFSDKRFDEYPVVNISKEGAELYCQWLSGLTKKGYANVAARLPYKNEWMCAASGGTKGAYPWGRDSIQNQLGCYLANFCIQKEKEKLRAQINARCSGKKYDDAHTSAGMILGDSVLTVQVFSYNPNDYGLYCMAGNVAEMTYDNTTKAVQASGGSWDSDFEHCKINSSGTKQSVFKANQMTGFRPVFRIAMPGSFGSIKREDPQTGLPTLTAEEIQSYQKQKKKMLEALSTYNKNEYAYLPMGSFIYRNDTISVQAFYMQTTEVTNLQYRTFLVDLLQQGRTEEFLKAKPDQKAWTTRFIKAYNEPMTNLYFSHPAFDEYPVVNITREAAQLYCVWLSQECNKLLAEKGKPLMNDVRLPVDIEWAYAASNKQNKAKYANGHEFLRDSKGRYEMNFSCAEMSQCHYDSTQHLYIPYYNITPKSNEEKLSRFITDGGMFTAYGRAYEPNNYGLYCMAGNVAEMVSVFNLKTRKAEQPGTKGGSWYSCDYFLEIDAPEEYPGETGASPLIGFRPVITALKK